LDRLDTVILWLIDYLWADNLQDPPRKTMSAATHEEKIALELKVRRQQVASTVELLDDKATVPFIARYRKEVTGSLDEIQITAIRDRITQLRELDKRREAILKSLDERGLLTDELKAEIDGPTQAENQSHHRQRTGTGAAGGAALCSG
jgi:transcriptional accessory protein Tex/SPT6